MTSPDGYTPAGAISSTGLADYAATTQEEWVAQIATDLEIPWGDSESGLLGRLFEGLSKGKPFVAALIEAILTAAFDLFPNFVVGVIETVSDAITNVRALFSGRWYDIANAQSAANYANAQIAAMRADMYDLFDIADEDGLSTDWDIVSQGPGSGYIYRDQDGNANWHESGGQDAGEFARYNVETTASDYQIITVVVPTPPQDPLLGDDSFLYILGRVVNSGTLTDDAVYAKIGNNSIGIGYLSSGTLTDLATTSYTKANGDTWQFHLGTTVTARRFVLYRNGVELLDHDDTGAALTQIGASYRSAGFGMTAGSRLIFVSQTSPGTIAVWSVIEPIWGS